MRMTTRGAARSYFPARAILGGKTRHTTLEETGRPVQIWNGSRAIPPAQFHTHVRYKLVRSLKARYPPNNPVL